MKILIIFVGTYKYTIIESDDKEITIGCYGYHHGSCDDGADIGGEVPQSATGTQTYHYLAMDGLVTREGITADLEAFKEAGLAGVQNFQIGGPRQIQISDTTVAIGSKKWKELIRWAMDECERLGLTFGTHNCPGWSSSAYSTVEVWVEK